MAIENPVIYSGSQFVIEWYFDERGESPARDYYRQLSVERQVKFIKLARLMGEVGKIFDTTKFRSEGDQIYAFKPQPDRYLCFFIVGRKIIVTNAFEKKSQKLPVKEKERALRSKKDFEERMKKGAYYEEE
jgi:phage-related protein